MVKSGTQLSALQRRISETLKQRRLVAIIGWKDSNHNTFTRSLSNNVIKFLDDSPGIPSQNIGYILFTEFISHSVSDRVKKAKEKECYHPIPIKIGQIKQILESCKDLLKPSVSIVRTTEAKTSELPSDNLVDHAIHDGLLDFLTQPQKELPEMTEMQKFALAFQDPLNKNAEGLVSSKTLGEILVACGIKKTNSQMVTTGWVKRAEPTDGKSKVFWYLPGRLIAKETAQKVVPLPETASGRAEYLIAQKPLLLAEKEKLAARQSEIDATLEMIANAEQIFGQIDQVLNSPKPI